MISLFQNNHKISNQRQLTTSRNFKQIQDSEQNAQQTRHHTTSTHTSTNTSIRAIAMQMWQSMSVSQSEVKQLLQHLKEFIQIKNNHKKTTLSQLQQIRVHP